MEEPDLFSIHHRHQSARVRRCPEISHHDVATSSPIQLGFPTHSTPLLRLPSTLQHRPVPPTVHRRRRRSPSPAGKSQFVPNFSHHHPQPVVPPAMIPCCPEMKNKREHGSTSIAAVNKSTYFGCHE
ncbi:hypothetical protein M0R45_006482 [Rubus argutus]|uniref:Uncharacterized protein n=1 Tax=Rubus argutus TaxID=59490 RepID=A0AAW1YQP5_RUBAR